MTRLFLLFLVLLALPATSQANYRAYIPLARFDAAGKRGIVLWEDASGSVVDKLDRTRPHRAIFDISWYKVEGTPGIYDWVDRTDEYYSILSEMGIEMWAILKMAPAWARINDPRVCGRIDAAAIPAFAQFAKQASLHYPQVRGWMVWNEPDSQYDSGWPPYDHYGCWGDASQPYYGGSYYAQVFAPVYAAIKVIQPDDLVYAGGFMMPLCEGPQAEYLHGALLAGMQPDGIALHYYDWYTTGFIGPECQVSRIRSWTDKPIFLTETSLLYEGTKAIYETAQAEFVHFISREVDRLGLIGFAWFGLIDSGWHHSSLYDQARCKAACVMFGSYDD